jgi:gamma-glutamylcyclotransferase (GGCT)/AIG2-like uncharacterized protein YtfP
MNVLVYGTLTDPERVRQVHDRLEFIGRATLVGLHLVEGRYPTLVPGGSTQGRLLYTESEGIDALDEYEGVDRGLYVRKTVPASTPALPDEQTVEVYIGDPDRLDAPNEWPGDGSFTERVERYLSSHEITVRQEPSDHCSTSV